MEKDFEEFMKIAEGDDPFSVMDGEKVDEFVTKRRERAKTEEETADKAEEFKVELDSAEEKLKSAFGD